jgi:hypothetical protein
MRRSEKLERMSAFACDDRIDARVRAEVVGLLGRVNGDPRRVDRLYKRAVAMVESAVVPAEERAPIVQAREVTRIVDAVTRAESALSAAAVEEIAAAVTADPVDVDDWRAVVRSAYRLLDRIDRVDAAVSGRRLATV